MTTEQWERIVKYVLCTIIGLGLGVLIGHPETPTIAVSAILMLYVDRGYTGSLVYSCKRIITQILMGGICFLVILGLRAFTPLPPLVVGIIAACIAMCIGLPLEYRRSFSPLKVTLGNSALIMTTGILLNPMAYPNRVLFCILGAIIAHVVNFGIMPRHNRYQETLQLVKEHSLLLLSEEGNAQSTATEGLAQTERNWTLIKEDNRWKSRAVPAEGMALLRAEIDMEKLLLGWQQAWKTYGEAATPALAQVCGELYAKANQKHQKLLQEEKAQPKLPAPNVAMAANTEDVHLLHALLLYLDAVEKMAGLVALKLPPQ